jgi:hypothetical protein
MALEPRIAPDFRYPCHSSTARTTIGVHDPRRRAAFSARSPTARCSSGRLLRGSMKDTSKFSATQVTNRCEHYMYMQRDSGKRRGSDHLADDAVA